MKHYLFFLISLSLITSCAGQTPFLDTASFAEIEEEHTNKIAVDVAQIHRTDLILEGNSNTFLTQIQEAQDAFGRPEQHRYITFDDDRGQTIWQGEQLVYTDKTLLFIQGVGLGGSHAIVLETSVVPTEEEIAASLGQPSALSRSQPDAEIRFVRAQYSDGGLWSFDVTINHADIGWQDYADGWQLETSSGEVLGTKILLHPHVNEMPFTRSIRQVAIPDDVDEIQLRSHDLASGYGLETVTVPLGQSGQGEKFEVIR